MSILFSPISVTSVLSSGGSLVYLRTETWDVVLDWVHTHTINKFILVHMDIVLDLDLTLFNTL